MKKLLASGVIAVIMSAVLLASCAPKAAEVPAAARPAATAAAPTPVANVEDVAWAKVVEAAKREGTLSIYSITLTGDVGIATARAFKDRYGVTVDVVSGRGAAFIERLKTEMRIGQVVGDVMESSTQHTLT